MAKPTLLLESETRQLLRRRAKKEQTYDDFIRELIAIYDRCKNQKETGNSWYGCIVP
jgi:hypothetical protein